jgi:predicted RNA-binding protein YlxR (DUF448 family)
MRSQREDGPRRTCIGCRQVRGQATLIRLVRRPEGTVVPDPHGRGRGAYVCPDPQCLERALTRLGRAFRKPSVAAIGLAEEVRGLWQRQR